MSEASEAATSKYRSVIPDYLFRHLSPAEEATFRQWARDNYRPDCVPDNFSVMHPVIRDEWRRIEATSHKP